VLYKKNNSRNLDMELFKNPTCEYRGTPFWAWNGRLDREDLLWQIEQFKEMGFGGFHMHSRVGLATEYLSDEFMSMVKACCNKAEALNMLAWLYDEDKWPSGSAGGIVTKNKSLRTKSLELYPIDKKWNTPEDEAAQKGVPYLLGCYDITLDSNGYIENYSRIGYEDSARGDKWYAYCVSDPLPYYFAYIDTMDRDAVAEFIRVTHERYKAVVGGKFNKSVPAIFTDEPCANISESLFIPTPEYKDRIKLTWTRFFEKKYTLKYKESFLDFLPELVWNKRDGSDSKIKYRYFDFIAEEFSRNFSQQIGDWCRENGLMMTGHYLHEPRLHHQAISCGEVMRNYGKMDIPGIDMLCDDRELTTAKQAQSAVHQYGKEGMLSELYGVTNWDFDFRGHKMQGDWQAALGVTVRVPHLAWMSMKGDAKRDYPASISYQSPWYKEYSYIENHFSRLNTVLTRGKPIVKIGVIHPIESYWISGGPVSQTSSAVDAIQNNFDNVTKWLLYNHLDFDFICESTLPELKNDERPLSIGEMRYDTIVVPGCITLRETTVEYLDSFRKNGGEVIFMGACPTHINGVRDNGCEDLFNKSISISFNSSELQSALESARTVRILNARGNNETNLIYNYRQDNDCRWLFIACAGDFDDNLSKRPKRDIVQSERLTITVEGECVPTEYDTLFGDVKYVEYTHKNGNTVIEYTFTPCNSVLFRLSDKEEIQADSVNAPKLVREYSIKKAVDYSLSEPNVLLLDQGEYRYDNGEWRESEEILRISRGFRSYLNFEEYPPQPYAVKDKPITHTLSLRFAVNSEIEVEGTLLALEDADIAKITFNGIQVPNEIKGYFTDKSIMTVALPPIKRGENVLEITFPFGEKTNVEWCYILGDFGVRLTGCEKTVVKRQEKLGFGDITPQTLPFYSANVNYSFDVNLEEDGMLEIEASHYRGALIAVMVDGAPEGRIVLPPYRLMLDDVKKGNHRITLTLFGNRNNSFGALHLVKEDERWYGPGTWRTEGANWCYEYKTKPLGIIKSPVIRIYKK